MSDQVETPNDAKQQEAHHTPLESEYLKRKTFYMDLNKKTLRNEELANINKYMFFDPII